jgi:uncharacterized DUF497 family protein
LVSDIRMTTHARTRALERGIDLDDIERIINSPMQTIYAEYEERYKSYGIVTKPYSKEVRYLIIVHTILNKYVTIISVMYTSKGGLQEHGFSNI